MAKPVSYDASALRAYLLGQDAATSPGSGVSLSVPSDDEVFLDDDLYHALELERQALLDDLVAGRLSQREEALVQQQSRLSATLQQDVSTQRALQTALLRQQHASGATRRFSSRPESLWARWTWRLPAASLLAAAAGCLLLLLAPWHRLAPRSAVSSAALSVHQDAPTSSLALNTDPVRTQAFYLAGTTTRGSSYTPVLKITPGVVQVDLELPLRSSAHDSLWTLRLMEGNQEIWHADQVTERPVGAEKILVAEVPANVLHSGTFGMAITDQKTQHVLPERIFQVMRTR